MSEVLKDVIATQSSQLVLSEIVGRVGIIRLNRPKKLNALNGQLMNEVTSALKKFETDPTVGAVVLVAEGRAFSAGFDLKEISELGLTTAQEWADLLRADFDFVMQFWDCPKPTIAAIHGFCIGGAMELAISCDLTIADEHTLMGEPEMKFGSSVAALVLPWLTGAKQAKELLLTANDRLSAQRAYELGLVNEVTKDGKHFERAMTIAQTMASYSSVSIQMTKKAINRSLDIGGMRQALLAAIDSATLIEANTRVENQEFERIRKTEGMKAALEWRDGVR
jgi:enoyl-CoA hydratase